MTDREICELIVLSNGNCLSMNCADCPLYGCKTSKDCYMQAKKWLDDHKEEKITELEKLRKKHEEMGEQVAEMERKAEEAKRIVFDPARNYGLLDRHGRRYLLCGSAYPGHCRFHNFSTCMTVCTSGSYTGQSCIDCDSTHGTIKIFDSRKEALEWMLDEKMTNFY